MGYDPRTIGYRAEIIYPPMPLPADAVQTIHNTLYRQAEVRYQNFQIAPNGIHLTNLPEQPGAVSSASFTPDRLVLREEMRSLTVEDFATRVVNVAGVALRALGIQATVAQQFAVQSLVNPRSVADSREFLARRVVAAPEDAWAALGRPMQGMGLSFVFPQTQANPEMFNLRVETWHQDPRSLWIENVGSFTRPVPAERIPDLSNLLFATYKFVTGPVARFLAQFDAQ